MSMKSFAYLALAIALCVFGFFGLLSIGAPFLLTGVPMLIVYPWRSRRSVLWPTLASVWALSATYVLVAPLGCSSSGSAPSLPGSAPSSTSGGVTSCANLLGIDYSGGASYNPPLLPALLAGIAVAIVVALALRALLVRRAVTA